MISALSTFWSGALQRKQRLNGAMDEKRLNRRSKTAIACKQGAVLAFHYAE